MDDRTPSSASAIAGTGLPNTPTAPSESAHPGLIQILSRQRWLIFAFLGAALVVAGVYIVVKKPEYTARSTVKIELVVSQAIGESESAARAQGDTADRFLATEREVMTSAAIMAKTLAKLGSSQYHTFDGVVNTLGMLRHDVRVEAEKRGNVLGVEFDSPYRTEAIKIVKAVVDSYLEYNREERERRSKDLLGPLEDSLKGVEKRYFELSDQIRTLSADANLDLMQQQLTGARDMWNRRHQETLEAKSAYDEAFNSFAVDEAHSNLLREIERSEGTVPSSADYLSQIRASILDLQGQLMLLQRDYTSEHPIVKNLASRLERQRALYALATQRVWVEAQHREEAQKQELDSAQAALNVVQPKKYLLDSLRDKQNNLKDEQARYQSRIKDVETNTSAGAAHASLIDTSDADIRPTKPSRLRALAVALAIGLALGVVGAHLKEWNDPRLHNVAEIKASLGLPVLGVVPRMPAGHSDAIRAQTVRLDASSDIAEAYRTIRTAIRYRSPDKPAKTLLVTSPTWDEGKTTLASNLAIAMAQAGRRVLLIDADFRSPAQHQLFDVSEHVGLSSVLQDEESLDNAIQRTAVERLDLLPCGPIPNTPSEMLNGEKFIAVLGEAASRYDQVILDSAALAEVSDARIIGANCDGTLLVVRAGRTERRRGEQACDDLLSVGAHILGVIVNDVPRRGSHDNSGPGGHEVSVKSTETVENVEPVAKVIEKPPASEPTRSGRVTPPTPDWTRVR